MSVVSAIFRTLLCAAAGLGCFLLLVPGFSALFMGQQSVLVLVICLGMVIGGAAIGAFARSIRRAFGWAILGLALCTLTLPLTTMLLAGRVATEQINAAEASSKGVTALGSGLGATVLTGAATIIGLFFGAILLIVALILLLGGRREVILVDRATGGAVPAVAGLTPRQLDQLRRIEPPMGGV